MKKLLALLLPMTMLFMACFAATIPQKMAGLSRRDIPDPNTMVKLAQNGLRNMMVVAKLTADNELNLLKPKKPKVDPADADNSEFGVSANPNGGKQKTVIDTKTPVNV